MLSFSQGNHGTVRESSCPSVKDCDVSRIVADKAYKSDSIAVHIASLPKRGEMQVLAFVVDQTDSEKSYIADIDRARRSTISLKMQRGKMLSALVLAIAIIVSHFEKRQRVVI
jgi:hypothetical protein